MPRRTTKKRKGFYGKRPAEIVMENQQGQASERRHIGNQNNNSAGPSSSTANSVSKAEVKLQNLDNKCAKKLGNSDFVAMENKSGILTREKTTQLGMSSTVKKEELAHGNKIQNFTLLNDCISRAAVCRNCMKKKAKLQLFQVNNKRQGLAESLILRCSSCNAETPLHTSSRTECRGNSFEVNRRAVVASANSGRESVVKFCSTMGLSSPINKSAYNENLKSIETEAVKQAEEQMLDAAKRLYKKVELEHPEHIVDFNGTPVCNVSVTVDGTWQKRGHTSKIGVVFVISVETGEILDYEVKSKICHQCKAHEKMDRNSEEFKQWYAVHKDVCQINHIGSSGEMEAEAAVNMFARSIESRKLKYTVFVGDGDSSCYGKVADAMKRMYGDEYIVVKEECVGHVQKRMGSALTEYKKGMKGKKLADGKGVGGAGRLTDDMIKRIQNYYGLAIRQNTGNVERMKTAVLAIKHHVICNDHDTLDKQHRFCPKDKDTWCGYWKNKHDKNSTYNLTASRLPSVFMTELEPIFTRLSSNQLLQRCLKGLTQNQNEAVNGQLWSRISKVKFCGARKVRIAVCQTVAISNSGHASSATLMKKLGVEPGRQMLKAVRKQDKERLQNAAKKVSDKYRRQRKLRRLQHKKTKKCTSYISGAFGLGSEAEKPTEDQRCTKRRKQNENASLPTQAQQNEFQHNFVNHVEIKFAEPEMEVILPRKKQKLSK